MGMIDPETLQKLLMYNPDTGELIWRSRERALFKSEGSFKTWNYRWANGPALTAISDTGYRHGNIFGRKYKAHRVAWAIHYGEWPEFEIDHIDGNRVNNQIENLRNATRSENARNRKSSCLSHSKYLGVTLNIRTMKWVARVKSFGKVNHIGVFDDEKDAARAYDRVAIMMHGMYANVNFKESTP